MKSSIERREFVFGVAVEDFYFTDRGQESLQLKAN